MLLLANITHNFSLCFVPYLQGYTSHPELSTSPDCDHLRAFPFYTISIVRNGNDVIMGMVPADYDPEAKTITARNVDPNTTHLIVSAPKTNTSVDRHSVLVTQVQVRESSKQKRGGTGRQVVHYTCFNVDQ